MVITLTSPSGTEVLLFNRSCGFDQDLMIGYDDSGISPLACPPIDAQSYQPASPLAAFDGENGSGLWTLSITDNAFLDEGTLMTWTLEICTQRAVFDCSDITDLDNIISDGSYNYTDTLSSSGTVPLGGSVVFRAPNGILLDPGFQVDRNALFEAYLEACEE